MSTLTVQLPESLHRSIAALAEQEGYSIDQFLASAAAEKLAALRTVEYLRREGEAGRRGQSQHEWLHGIVSRVRGIFPPTLSLAFEATPWVRR